MTRLVLTPLLCGVILAGCTGVTAHPDWVGATSDKYKTSQYLVGRGQAASEEDAQNRARAEIAKIFEVSIDVASEDMQSFKSVSADGKSDSSNEASVTRTISARTNQVVQGIQIAEVWQDPQTKTHYALAVLPRASAAHGLREEIARLDQATRRYLTLARSETDLLRKIGAAHRALDAQGARAGYQKSLRVVDLSGRGTESEWSVAALRADLDALLKRVRIAPVVASDGPAELATALSGGIAAAGFDVAPGAQAPYALEGTLQLEDLGERDGWHWQRGVLEIKLYDRSGSRVQGTKRWEIKAAGAQPASARQRAFDQVDTILKKELRATVIGFADA
jgi:hypothetical protein